MTDRAGDADADVIAAGRQARTRPPWRGRLIWLGRPPWRGRLIWLLVLAETAALAASVAAAAHYRSEAGRLPADRPPAASEPVSSPVPGMASVTLQLPADGTVAGTVVITAASMPGAGRAQFTVSAVLTGGKPGTVYDLTGNDCSTSAPLPDHVWASGLANAHGAADLIGYAWTGRVTDTYWLALDPSPVSPPPGLRGQFAEGKAAPFPAGQQPCAP